MRIRATVGCLLGTAVGDALGLPFEGLSRRRQQHLYPEILGHRFLFGRGMFSDDTEQTLMVAQALIVSAGDVGAFEQDLARRFRFWLLGLPAGVGSATLRAIVKLWLGFPPGRSGVFSAGNGAAMRNAIIGVCHGQDFRLLRDLVHASTRLTHTDLRAEVGALAVAVAAHLSSRCPDRASLAEAYNHSLHRLLPAEADDFLGLIEKTLESAGRGETTQAFARALGCDEGVSGYVYHTVPTVIHAWLSRPDDYQGAIIDVVRCGGDTDTTAAILGGIIGARVGKAGIPQAWIDGVWEWPRTVAWIEALGVRLAEVCSGGDWQPAYPLPYPAGLLLRNAFFLFVVLAHGFRRLAPPY